MKFRFLSFLVFSAAAVVGMGAVPPESNKVALDLGMDAATITRIYGKPAEIQPMEMAEAKAEKWLYRRKAKEYTTQEASTVTMVPAFIGISGSGAPMIADTPSLSYKVKLITVYQVTALLMVDGKLTRGKQWVEREEKYTN